MISEKISDNASVRLSETASETGAKPHGRRGETGTAKKGTLF